MYVVSDVGDKESPGHEYVTPDEAFFRAKKFSKNGHVVIRSGRGKGSSVKAFAIYGFLYHAKQCKDCWGSGHQVGWSTTGFCAMCNGEGMVHGEAFQ